MITYENGSCGVYIPTLAAMILATKNTTDYDDGLCLELLKQRHMEYSDSTNYPTLEDFTEAEVKDAKEALKSLRKCVIDEFLPSMLAKGYTHYDIEDECCNPIFSSEYDSDNDWHGTWHKIHDMADYICDYVDYTKVNNRNSHPSFEETEIFEDSCVYIEPEDKGCLFCIFVRFYN